MKIPFEKVVSPRKSELVVEQIVSEISKGVYRPGDKLPSEERIAKEVGVSRSSVREAITVLRLQGIIETRHGNGSIVRNVQHLKEDLASSLGALQKEAQNPYDIFIVRECVEPALVGLAVENALEEQIINIERHLESMGVAASVQNLDECFASNIRFHLSVIEATNNDVAIAMFGSLYQVLKAGYEEDRLWRKIINEYHCSEQNCRQCLADHRAILKAIKTRDSSSAQNHFVEHFKNMRCELFGG